MNRLKSLAGDTRGGNTLKACVMIVIVATMVLGPQRIATAFHHAKANWEDIWMMYRV